ncbi:MAG: L,D-transpeptidase family protein [Clostridiales bacterium]|jgi:L,D-peptidoglycan transpeptidase YkuD (ErfK/YbiS/YcfS/YnhG family)|nr:L,D-transpeptidase family protein [Clostridiales bacterium]
MKKVLAFLLITYICLVTTIPCASQVYASSNLTVLFDRLNIENGSSQIIVVSSEKEGHYKATVETFEKTIDGWNKSLPPMNAVIGEKGFSLDKKEGDLKAPAGIFRIGTAFGTIDRPTYIKLSYKKTSKNDYWIDDVYSQDYNNWVEFEGDPYSKWKSFEKLMITSYKLAFVIEYNMNPAVKGKGSAIFCHIWQGSNISTKGCTALSEANISKLLNWIDPKKNPLIIQGTADMLEDMVKATENELLYPIEVVVNEEKVVFDVPPRILNGRTLIPVRSVFESLGAEVLWDESAKTVTILKEAKSIKLKVESNWVHVDEKQVEIDIPVSIINGRTMVPVRFIAEELGFEVTWDGEKRVVFIKTEN